MAAACGGAAAVSIRARCNVTSFRNRAGQVINFSHDDLGRMTAKDLPNTILHEMDIAYGYDLLGRLTSAVDGYDTKIRFAYDPPETSFFCASARPAPCSSTRMAAG